MSPSQILFLFLIFFLSATFLNFYFQLDLKILFFILMFLFFFCFFIKKSFLIFLLFFAFFLGSLHTQYFLFKGTFYFKNFEGQKVTLEGIVDEEPVFKEKFQIVKIKLENNLGNLILFLPKNFSLEIGDKILISGKLKRAPSYFLKDKVFFVLSFPKIEKIEKQKVKTFKKLLLDFVKNSEKKILSTFKNTKEGALMISLLTGRENYFSKEDLEVLNNSGLRHICAISGMNITILSSVLLSTFLFFGLSKKVSFFASLFLIFLYIFSIGAPASGLRAAIMSFFSRLGCLFGRKTSSNLALVLAAFLMVLFNPAILVYDVGFQLSFLAMLGMINLENFFQILLRKVPNFANLRYNLATTLSAQFFVFPLLLFYFGNLSLVSPLSNILVLPLLPYLTALGFFLLIFNFSNFISQILAFFLFPFLNYILFWANFFSKFLTLKIEYLNFAFLFLYLPLFWFTKKAKEWAKLKFLQIL